MPDIIVRYITRPELPAYLAAGWLERGSFFLRGGESRVLVEWLKINGEPVEPEI
jgi:hypothetical protein